MDNSLEPLSQNSLPENAKQNRLRVKIAQCKAEIAQIEQELFAFEQQIRVHLSEQIIQVQELTVLYKQQKKAKKEQRLRQKQKGKNYTPSQALQIQQKTPRVQSGKEDEKELKRLYREAMWLVHPDKFSMQEEMETRATELTQQLVAIYEAKDLARLKVFYEQLTANVSEVLPSTTALNETLAMLEVEYERLCLQLTQLKNRILYKALQEFENPLAYIQLLREYYEDKLFKLKKRTRTK